MPSYFGLKIGIEGEKEFKKALFEINKSFKVLGSEMNLVAPQFDKQDKSVGTLTARNQVLRKEIDAQKDKVEALETTRLGGFCLVGMEGLFASLSGCLRFARRSRSAALPRR